ncbi:hypothetical protein FGO68_gene1248 [Halteria grandinella]|uniref:Transmembrane protein n=1 Tax=Halteria grandinella TaxID=5974 RepID=A0A8J8SY25_HALGN|nr:hypothetical protein FGO68_gene1248 [Halteria grandinella]
MISYQLFLQLFSLNQYKSFFPIIIFYLSAIMLNRSSIQQQMGSLKIQFPQELHQSQGLSECVSECGFSGTGNQVIIIATIKLVKRPKVPIIAQLTGIASANDTMIQITRAMIISKLG